MATVREATPGNQDLQTFETVIQQQEGIFGRLVSIESESSNNIMTFQIGPSPTPDHRANLIAYSDHPPKKDGFVLICIGGCLVDSKVQQIAAYRKSP